MIWTEGRNKQSTRTERRNKNSKKKKNEERLKKLQDNFKHSNIQVIGVSEWNDELKEIENILKENFPNLAKEIDFQEVQESQRVPKKLDPRKRTCLLYTSDAADDLSVV